MSRLTYKNCCFYIDLRIGCQVIAYFSLASYIAWATWIIYYTATMPSRISLKDSDFMEKLTKVLLIGQSLFLVPMTLIKYTVVLILGLRRKSRFLINLYLAFAKYAFCVFVTVCVVLEYCYPMDPYVNATTLSIPVHASFIYAIRRYWNTLEPTGAKMVKHVV